MDKQAKFEPYSDWAEVFFLIILFVGIVLGVLSPNPFITYSIAFFAGAICGRWFLERRYKGRGPYTILMIGFILGYVIGTFQGTRWVTVVMFLVGAVLTYYVYKKGWIKDIMY